MSSFALTANVLIWPVLATMVLTVLCIGLVRDIRTARRTGNDMI